MLQEAPRHEAVLGRKVRLVIWDTTSRGEGREKNIQKIWERRRGGQLPELLPHRDFTKTTNNLLHIRGEHRKDSFNLQPQTPGQQISFIFYPTHPLHYLFYLLTGQSHPSRGGRKAKHSRDRDQEVLTTL